jgi:hypothetical protein
MLIIPISLSNGQKKSNYLAFCPVLNPFKGIKNGNYRRGFL